MTARDLVDGDSVRIDTDLREVTYVHLLLARHEVLLANGIATESLHPASSGLGTIDGADRARLHALLPGLALDPRGYGDTARRQLSAAEAALLMHEAA